MGTWVNVLISHLLLVIPMSYPYHYTNLCPHMSQKRTRAHTHTHTHILVLYFIFYLFIARSTLFVYILNL